VIVLALDSATPACSVALLADTRIAADMLVEVPDNHTQTLLRLVDQVLEYSGHDLKTVDLVAVTRGPGSFTGLRSGVSTAQGLGFALGKPVRGMSTLEVLARQIGFAAGSVCPMIDARRDQVYTALYVSDGRGAVRAASAEMVIHPREWLERLEAPVVFVGSGATKYGADIKKAFGGGARILPEYFNAPRAAVLAWAARDLDSLHPVCDADSLVPGYIRDPDARIPGGSACS
jgi:tRNA threonylcarbamoyladenosine biosynthesis protein TsaB